MKQFSLPDNLYHLLAPQRIEAVDKRELEEAINSGKGGMNERMHVCWLVYLLAKSNIFDCRIKNTVVSI